MGAVACPYCDCDQLTSIREGPALRLADPLVCGACGSLSILDLEEGSSRPIGRRPSTGESQFWRADPDLAKVLTAYTIAALDGRSKQKGPPRPSGRTVGSGRFVWKGPPAR